jgi:GrpE protein
MKRKLFKTALLVLFISLAGPALGQGNRNRGGTNTRGQNNSNRVRPDTQRDNSTNRSAPDNSRTNPVEPPTTLRDTPQPNNTNNEAAETSPARLNERLKALEEKPLIENELWPLGWVLSTGGLGLVFFLILLALVLHLVHVLRVGGLNRDFDQLAMRQQSLGNTARGPVPPSNSLKVDKLAEQLNHQAQSLAQFSTRFNQIENRFTINDSQLRDAVHAVTLTASWIGQAQLREAFAAGGGNVSESERAATMALLERYQEPLRLNAGRVGPVAQGFTEAVERLERRANTSPELIARLQSLSEDIGRFGQWHKDVSDELTSLQRGSFSQRNAGLQADQERLFDQVNSGSLSTVQMVKKSRALLDHYFPETPAESPDHGQPLPERETSLKKRVADAPDYLMNWYDTLFQLQSQIGGSAQRSAVEAETASDLSRIQQIARDALGKFDIQPEAIQIGQTSYDRRLHEAALVRQAPQFPVNTVIEVHKCGFRKMSTGEVLRMPQVVVAGAAVT